MDSGSSRLHVVPSLSGGWVVRETADGPALRWTNTRRGALGFATDVLFRGRGGAIEVHEVDGTVVESYRVEPRGERPWWYTPPRIPAVLMGSFFIVEGVVDVWSYAHVMFWLGWVFVVTGTVQLTSFLLSTRLDQRLKVARTSAAGR